MTDQLRAALGADTDTPAGVDVGAVRRRARQLRRRRTTALAGTAAVLTAAAIVVPAGLLGGGGSGPDTGPVAAPAGTAAIETCPDESPLVPRNTGPGLADRLVPITPDRALLCSYAGPEPGTEPGSGSGTALLTGVVRVTAADLRSAVTRLEAGSTEIPDLCPAIYSGPLTALVAGDGTRTVTVLVSPGGCATASNGTRTLSFGVGDLSGLARTAAAVSACPARLPDLATVRPATRAATLLPVGTRRLLVCAYPPGGGARRPSAGPGWDAVTDPETTRSLVTRLNALPDDTGMADCAADGSDDLLVVAVTPDRVTKLVGPGGACRHLGDGTRWVRSKPVTDQLLRLAHQR